MGRKMLVADLLCGAGGSSTGAQRALSELGLDMELVCVNHWPTAIATHTLNHPEARHYVQDIATVRPHLLVPEGYLDLLMASPTCTHHSVARGGKPTSDQQRSDPWHIITWLTELRVKRIIIENVWEFVGWGPVDHRTGKPIKSRKGEYFHAWIETLKRLGFDPEWRKLNAADYGDATTRQRFILMARSDGRRVSWPMPTHRRRDGAIADLFDTTKPWRPAREIIDWKIKGKSIFGRKKALAPKTLARIYAGAVKFGWPEPFLVVLRNHMAGQSVDGPLPTIAANGTHIGLAEPVIMNGRRGNQAKPVSTEPIPTLDTKGGVWLAEPLVLSQHNSGAARTAGQPLPTITTGGAGAEKREGCARPMLVEPFVLSQASGGSPRAVSDPIPTAPTGGAHALISPYYGSGSGETCNTVEDALPTITAKGRFGMVVPVTNKNGGAGARDIDVDPIATMTTAKGGEFAIVMPVTHHDGSDRTRDADIDPLPTVTGANRGELAFIAAQFGEREGQAPRVHDIDNPAPTIAATGHINLVRATTEYDILFRMLEPHELAAAMGFNTDEARYEFAGTKTEKIKQIGNAVSVSKMKACVGSIMADAAPTTRPKFDEEFREAAE
ncbi:MULTISPECIES: DNA cytosine methyltransferase [unclassified Mesorhizobium]|uniref:DNA cytosine methyltransferase n=1 Tax=unclassified Mesorhizobium TaxID=325217 RepID=UPI001125F2A5|nr:MULTISPECIES: DNA cytosine methyltransferase [unclassified Mesorhizobium]TPK59089.1 DNA cytosine methyltransferase [Mesorhizobium sp. B2-5-1]TPL06730.1 DNA cytosine methyltransferase [Mesorhizobium sp. B2-4-11]